MIRLGAPIFLNKHDKAAGAAESHGADATDPVALAKAHKVKGYTAAYAPIVRIHETEKIKEVRRAFAAEDVMIAEYGYWNNLMHADAEIRQCYRQEMLEAYAVAEEMGARCVVGLIGSRCAGSVPSRHTEDNFKDDLFNEAVDLARYFIDTLKPKTTYFTYEIFPFSILDSPEMIVKFMGAVDRKQFGIHFDLVNLINSPRKYFRSGEIARECMRLFGDRIVSAHAKDIRMKEPSISVILEEVMPGEGNLDIAANIRELHQLPQTVPFMIEHLNNEEEYDQAASHFRRVAANEGIPL